MPQSFLSTNRPARRLDNGAVPNPGPLGHDDDAVAYAVVLFVFLLQVVSVDDGDAVSDANIFIDDGIDDGAVISDAYVGNPSGGILFKFPCGLKVVGAHND